jgi:hypothetical protein
MIGGPPHHDQPPSFTFYPFNAPYYAPVWIFSCEGYQKKLLGVMKAFNEVAKKHPKYKVTDDKNNETIKVAYTPSSDFNED